MKFLNVIFAMLLVIGSGASFAVSNQISLSGDDIIAPQQKLTISFLNVGMMQGLAYSATCKISNTNSEPVVLNFAVIENYSVAFNAEIDGRPLSVTHNAELTPGEHTYTVHRIGLMAQVMNIAQMEFINLDFNNAISVSNCIAKPAI